MRIFNLYVPWKYMIGWYVLAMVLALQLTSCGTRKSSASIKKIEDVTQTKAETKEAIKDQESKTTTEVVKDSTDKKKESVSTETTEKFNPDGSLAERKTKTTTKKSTDNSTRSRNKVENYNRYRIHDIYRNIDTKRTQTSKEKDKVVDRSNTLAENLGGGWVIFGAIVVIGTVFFLTRWLVKKV